jgi:hypothetical protein
MGFFFWSVQNCFGDWSPNFDETEAIFDGFSGGTILTVPFTVPVYPRNYPQELPVFYPSVSH